MKKLLNIYTKINLVLFPLFFLPFVSGAYTFGKNWYLFVSALVGLLIWIISLLKDKQAKIYLGRGLGLFFVFLLWVFISFLRLSPSVKAYSLSEPGGLGSFVSLFIWYFLYLQTDQKNTWQSNMGYLKIVGLLTTIFSLITFIMPESKLPIVWPSKSPLLSIDKNWSLTGSLMIELGLFIFLAVESARLLFVKSQKKAKNMLFDIFKTALICFGLFLTIYKISKVGWGGLNFVIGWQITADTFKYSPIFGVGISNFLKAFNLFRPYSYNQTPFWQDRFIYSSSGFFHYWTELGIVYLILALVALKKVFANRKPATLVPLLVVFLINLVFPPNLLSLWLMAFVFSHKFGTLKSTSAKLVLGEAKYNTLPLITTVVVLSFSAFGFLVSTKKLLSKVYLRKSILATAQNDGLSVYNNQIKAISYDPNYAELRRLYSQTNIALAQSLSQKEELTEEDKQQISVLLQQAVREAKQAIDLDGASAIYWSNLATIYKNLIGSVEGAPDWAVEAYQQTAVLDPSDPLVRMELGSLYYAANQFENADRLFEEVLLRKTDFANGWYNWAHTAKNLNKLADAINRLNQAVLLVPVDSTDYENANKELASWREEYDKLVKQNQPQTQEEEPTLKTPEPLPTVSQETQVNIPEEELEPPVTQTEPSPVPTEASEATPTPDATVEP